MCKPKTEKSYTFIYLYFKNKLCLIYIVIKL